MDKETLAEMRRGALEIYTATKYVNIDYAPTVSQILAWLRQENREESYSVLVEPRLAMYPGNQSFHDIARIIYPRFGLKYREETGARSVSQSPLNNHSDDYESSTDTDLEWVISFIDGSLNMSEDDNYNNPNNGLRARVREVMRHRRRHKLDRTSKTNAVLLHYQIPLLGPIILDGDSSSCCQSVTVVSQKGQDICVRSRNCRDDFNGYYFRSCLGGLLKGNLEFTRKKQAASFEYFKPVKQ